MVDEIDSRLLNEWIGVAVNEIKDKTPVITGRLKGSIDGEGSFNGDLISINTETDPAHFVETGVEYAAYVEFGTARQRAQNMFKRGLDATNDIIDEDIKELVEKEFDSNLGEFFKRIF